MAAVIEPPDARSRTGPPIAQGPGEQLQRIAWPGAPVVVVTRPGPDGELLYRLVRLSCQTWNPAAGLRFEPWPARIRTD